MPVVYLRSNVINMIQSENLLYVDTAAGIVATVATLRLIQVNQMIKEALVKLCQISELDFQVITRKDF